DPGPDDVRSWPACARLTAHAMAVFEHAPDSGSGAEKTSILLNQTALNYASRGAYAEAEPLYRRALAVDEAGYGTDHPTVAAVLLDNPGSLLAAPRRPAGGGAAAAARAGHRRARRRPRPPHGRWPAQQPGHSAQGHRPAGRGRAADAACADRRRGRLRPGPP